MAASSKAKTGAWRCVRAFSYPNPVGAGVVTVPAGAVVPYDLPVDVMKGREDLFEDLTSARVVEQASAGPGEKRSTVKG